MLACRLLLALVLAAPGAGALAKAPAKTSARPPAQAQRDMEAVVDDLVQTPADASAAANDVNDLGRCLVQASTPADRAAITRATLAMMMAHPQVQDLLGAPTPALAAARVEAMRGMGRVSVHLLLDACPSLTLDVLHRHGSVGIGRAFMALGQHAMGDIMKDPAVVAATSAVDAVFTKPETISRFRALAERPAAGAEVPPGVPSGSNPATTP